jgi:hypothetical protein
VSVSNQADMILIKGFLLAIQDCYLAKGVEAQVPDFVGAKLATLTGLIPQATRQTQLVAKAISCWLLYRFYMKMRLI